MKKDYEMYYGNDITKELLDTIKIGDQIICNNWKSPLKIRAVSKNYFVMVRNYFGEPLYSICEKKPCDFSRNHFSEGNFRIGTDNWVFGKYDYLKQEDCEEALRDLESGECELSVRRAFNLNRLCIKRAR